MIALDPSAGRSELERLIAGKTKRTQHLAWRVAQLVAAAVSQGEDPAAALNAAMAAVGMAKAVQEEVGAAVVQSLLVGAGVWPSVSATVDVGTLGKTALGSIWDGSSMTLSQRLHGSDQAMRSELVDIIKTHVQAKTSAWDASRQIFDGYGFGGAIHKDQLPELPKAIRDLLQKAGKVVGPEDLAQLKQDAKRLGDYASRLATGPLKAAYAQFAQRLEKGLTTGLDKLVETATYEKARYNASRILRTETARAWGQGFLEDCRKDPDVVGIRWTLSSSHKIFDICDFYASADLYGMGPGVYPLGKTPWYPAHPHCMCPLAKVYKWQVPAAAAKDQVQQGGAAALAKMTDSQRKRLMTIKGAKGFQAGGNWQSGLRGWSGMGGDALSSGAKAVLTEAVPVAKVFRAGKTVREAEAIALSLDLADRVSYKGMHLDAANAINRTLFKHLQNFPDLRKGLQFVGTAQERNRLARAARKTEGWPEWRIRRSILRTESNNLASSTDSRHVQYAGFNGIAFNEKAFGGDGFRRINERWSLSESGQGKYHPPGKDYTTDVVAHELGHQLDALFGLRADAEVLRLWDNAKKTGVHEAISGYALKGGLVEGIAEGWAEAFGSSSPRPFATGLRERILQLLGGSR